MKSFPAGFLVITDIAEFTWGKIPVNGSLFELCINSDFTLEKILFPRQNIQAVFVEFCGDKGTAVLLVAKNSQFDDIYKCSW